MQPKSEHHPTRSPSRIPGLYRCPCYEGGGSNSRTEKGTLAHARLAALLTGNEPPEMPQEDCAAVDWAYKLICDMTPSQRKSEEPIDVIGNDFGVWTYGTADVVLYDPQRPVVIDYKHGRMSKPYDEQVMIYAYGVMQRTGATACETVIMYGGEMRYKRNVVFRSECERLLRVIEEGERNPKPRPCEFCDWCKHATTCPAVAEKAVEVVAGYAEEKPFELATFHASQIAEPEQMSKALALAGILEGWAKSVKHHAKELAKSGVEIPGYVLLLESEKREINDIMGAYQASGLTAEDFLSACSVSVPDLEKVLAKQGGLKTVTKKVKEELAKRMGALIEIKRGDNILKKAKDK
jgi:hypothetical protein